MSEEYIVSRVAVDAHIALGKYTNNHPVIQCPLPDAMESGPNREARRASLLGSTASGITQWKCRWLVMMILLGHGAKVHLEDSKGRTPLHLELSHPSNELGISSGAGIFRCSSEFSGA